MISILTAMQIEIPRIDRVKVRKGYRIKWIYKYEIEKYENLGWRVRV